MGAEALLDTHAKDLQALTFRLSPPAWPRRLIGWAIDEHLRTDLVKSACCSADQGSVICSKRCRAHRDDAIVMSGISRKDRAYRGASSRSRAECAGARQRSGCTWTTYFDKPWRHAEVLSI
jgi:hypothetical protein